MSASRESALSIWPSLACFATGLVTGILAHRWTTKKHTQPKQHNNYSDEHMYTAPRETTEHIDASDMLAFLDIVSRLKVRFFLCLCFCLIRVLYLLDIGIF